MATHSETLEFIREIFDVVYGEDDSPYPFHHDFNERMEEIIEMLDNLEDGVLKQGLISALEKELYPNLPFGEWTHYDTINEVIYNIHNAFCEVADKNA